MLAGESPDHWVVELTGARGRCPPDPPKLLSLIEQPQRQSLESALSRKLVRAIEIYISETAKRSVDDLDREFAPVVARGIERTLEPPVENRPPPAKEVEIPRARDRGRGCLRVGHY